MSVQEKSNEKSNLNEFNEFFIELKESLLKKFSQNDDISSTIERFEQVIDYNVPHGKKLRGLCTYDSYLIISKKVSNQSQVIDCIKKSKALGWCIELLQASFLIADDIMDNSKTRRGQPCWYLNKNVGNVAINDAFFVLSCVYITLKNYLYDHQLYHKFYELFSEVFMQTTIGQEIDLLTGSHESTSELFDFEKYNIKTYDSIVIWKTAYYSFYLPVASTLFLAHIADETIHVKVKKILLQMGHFFQVQDDYLDCYGDPKVTGKVGTDIEESKCSWLIIQALNKCNEEQKLILRRNYGKSDIECVKKVKNVFNELKLKEFYENYEIEQYGKINEEILNLI